MKVMIAGAGSVGRSIARDMMAREYDVVIVDRSPHAMRVASVPDADWVLGDACEPSVLEQVGLENTDVVVTATGDDKANLVVSLLSKQSSVSRALSPASITLITSGFLTKHGVLMFPCRRRTSCRTSSKRQ